MTPDLPKCRDCEARDGENAALRDALAPFAEFADALKPTDGPLWTFAQIDDYALVVEMFRVAKKALADPSPAVKVLRAAKALAEACIASTAASAAHCDHIGICETCQTPDADAICFEGKWLGDISEKRGFEHAKAAIAYKAARAEAEGAAPDG